MKDEYFQANFQSGDAVRIVALSKKPMDQAYDLSNGITVGSIWWYAGGYDGDTLHITHPSLEYGNYHLVYPYQIEKVLE